jgi:hypothetical protein
MALTIGLAAMSGIIQIELDYEAAYFQFEAPVTLLDCGSKCSPYNPSGKPFCCDICLAVPAAYHNEWEYLQRNTELWHEWRGDECPGGVDNFSELMAETPSQMRLLACKGPQHCQREFRAISCRQFPFFPYITSDLRFIGLAYEWEYEITCWVISNLGQVSSLYRDQFVRFYDDLFRSYHSELEGYAIKSEEMRSEFSAKKRRIPILHRRGGFYLLSPSSERLQISASGMLRRFGPYKNSG